MLPIDFALQDMRRFAALLVTPCLSVMQLLKSVAVRLRFYLCLLSNTLFCDRGAGMGSAREDGGRQRRSTGHLQAGQHQLPQVSPPFSC